MYGKLVPLIIKLVLGVQQVANNTNNGLALQPNPLILLTMQNDLIAQNGQRQIVNPPNRQYSLNLPSKNEK
jgi:hypothetical protein